MYLDDAINQFAAMAELGGEHCQLYHSPEDPAEEHPAIDYLYQGFGCNGIKEHTVRIPVCQDCLEAMQPGSGWVLVYCVACLSSGWRQQAKSMQTFDRKVYWLAQCPRCKGEL